MVLVNLRGAPVPVKRSRSSGSKGKLAPALAKAAARKPAASEPAPRWGVLASLPRTIRSRLLARGSKNGAKAKPSAAPAPGGSWTLGQWLGGAAAAAAAALASVQGGAKAKAGAAPAAEGGEEPTLYMDSQGNAHLGVNPGDDRQALAAARHAQAEEQAAAARAVERRSAATLEGRREAAAAREADRRRAPAVEKPTTRRGAPRKAARQNFQPAPRRFA